jgi:hypothetical protein
MRKHLSSLATLLGLALASPMFLAYAQVVSGSPEMPTGDVWQSDAEYNRLPMLDDVETDEEPPWSLSPTGGTAVLHANCTAHSEHEARHRLNASQKVAAKHRQDLKVARLRDGRHAGPAFARRIQVVSFRCVLDAPHRETGRRLERN